MYIVFVNGLHGAILLYFVILELARQSKKLAFPFKGVVKNSFHHFDSKTHLNAWNESDE